MRVFFSLKCSCFFLCGLSALLLSSCGSLRVREVKDITYSKEQHLMLNVYSPKKKTVKPKSVLVFMHGGNWTNGTKALYKFFGRGMAKKGVVGVVIDYRKYPNATYGEITMDAAQAVKWVNENIRAYGGDPNKIFVSGHSAGAHLAALISTDNSYFDSLKMSNPVKGAILIDPFGLDMYTYLKKEEKYNYDKYRTLFSKDPEQWKAGSPVHHLHQGMPRFLLFAGKKTYPNIINESNAFLNEVKKYQQDAQLIMVPRKRHAGMIFSFVNPRKTAYRQILDFMEIRP